MTSKDRGQESMAALIIQVKRSYNIVEKDLR